MSKLIHDVACTACGCICDDVIVEVEGNRVVSTQNACRLGQEFFLRARAPSPSPSPADWGGGPAAAFVNGAAVELPAAIDAASRLLAESKAPLIYGLAHSDVAAQRAAVELADRLGATIDPALAPFHRDSLVAMQNVGVSTCTLGEVKNRADVIVIWGADPQTTHPRLFERFVDPPGVFVPGGRSGRRVIVVDSQETETARLADQFLRTRSGSSFELLAALRMAGKGLPLGDEQISGLAAQEVRQLAKELQAANYAVVFFGPDVCDAGLGHANLESLFLLVRELNATSRCAAIGLGGPVAENVLTWQTGYPCGVNFAAGYPRYDPLQYSANLLLERHEVDAAILVNCGDLAHLSSAARQRLEKIPVIFLNFGENNFQLSAGVRIQTAVAGFHHGGSTFRMDGVPLPLRSVLESPLPSEAEVLSAVVQRIIADR